MEPPAVSLGLGYQRGSGSLEKSRCDLMLRIDPQITYASTSRAFEELPENFLETISPQQQSSSTCALELNTNHLRHEFGSSCLSPGIGDQRFSNENVDILPSINSAGLLVGSVVDDLSHESRRSAYIIKEESPDVYHSSGTCETIYLPSSFEHDDGDICNMHSPISLQNDLITSVLSSEEHFLPVRQPEPMNVEKHNKSPSPMPENEEKFVPIKDEEETLNTNYSTFNDQLNVNLDDNSYLDTKDLCRQIANELKQHSIPQAVFAEKILCRSQGTLSDLLRNPKPWEKLKSGRETFRRMYNWVGMPLHIRLAILDIKKDATDFASFVNSSPPTPAKSTRIRQPSVSDDGLQSKRPRLVFSDVQKRTLQAIFKETQRPSREMQTTIAEHLGLDLSTVSNFFMNARRRSRNGGVLVDEGGSSEQATPPPRTPPKTSQRRHNASSSSSNSGNQINETVDAVIANFKVKEDPYEESLPNYPNRSRSSRRLEQKFQIKSEREESPTLRNDHL